MVIASRNRAGRRRGIDDGLQCGERRNAVVTVRPMPCFSARIMKSRDFCQGSSRVQSPAGGDGGRRPWRAVAGTRIYPQDVGSIARNLREVLDMSRRREFRGGPPWQVRPSAHRREDRQLTEILCNFRARAVGRRLPQSR
jgi:hypothetical protein